MNKGNYHVVRHSKGWALKGENSHRATSVHTTQKDAIIAGRSAARKRSSELIVHGENGKIREKDSYGNDPCPPKG